MFSTAPEENGGAFLSIKPVDDIKSLPTLKVTTKQAKLVELLLLPPPPIAVAMGIERGHDPIDKNGTVEELSNTIPSTMAPSTMNPHKLLVQFGVPVIHIPSLQGLIGSSISLNRKHVLNGYII